MCHKWSRFLADVIVRIETRHDWQQQRWKIGAGSSCLFHAQMNIIVVVVQSKPHSSLLAGVLLFFCLLDTHTTTPPTEKKEKRDNPPVHYLQLDPRHFDWLAYFSAGDSGSALERPIVWLGNKSRRKLLIFSNRCVQIVPILSSPLDCVKLYTAPSYPVQIQSCGNRRKKTW